VIAYRIPGLARDPLALEGALVAALWSGGAQGVSVDGDDVVAYFAAAIADLPGEGGWEEVDRRDYVAAYYADLAPVDTGVIVVAPTHRNATLRAGQQVIWLDPGMAFGTGHHETTAMALAALGRLDLIGKRVLDVGAGSGVLAIAATLLGARDVVGIDVDPDTLPVARANAARNRSPARFVAGAFGEVDLGRFDVVVANLQAEIFAEIWDPLAAVLAPAATLLMTGILDVREEAFRSDAARFAERVGGRLDGIDRAGAWSLHRLVGS
jgi:ribosomal protein L11 methyltransferase